MNWSDIPSRHPRTLHVANLESSDYDPSADREATIDPDKADVISSLMWDTQVGEGAQHFPVLDLDIPAYLLPSSTEGHSHLYLDVQLDDARFWALCDALAEAGILEPGYVSACKARGYTSVRLPWVKKAEVSA